MVSVFCPMEFLTTHSYCPASFLRNRLILKTEVTPRLLGCISVILKFLVPFIRILSEMKIVNEEETILYNIFNMKLLPVIRNMVIINLLPCLQ